MRVANWYLNIPGQYEFRFTRYDSFDGKVEYFFDFFWDFFWNGRFLWSIFRQKFDPSHSPLPPRGKISKRNREKSEKIRNRLPALILVEIRPTSEILKLGPPWGAPPNFHDGRNFRIFWPCLVPSEGQSFEPDALYSLFFTWRCLRNIVCFLCHCLSVAAENFVSLPHLAQRLQNDVGRSVSATASSISSTCLVSMCRVICNCSSPRFLRCLKKDCSWSFHSRPHLTPFYTSRLSHQLCYCLQNSQDLPVLKLTTLEKQEDTDRIEVRYTREIYGGGTYFIFLSSSPPLY